MSQSGRQTASVAGEYVLDVRGVWHEIDGTAVLDDITLSVFPGETLAVIGPSGTGKTTLLRLLSLFERPDRGQIRLDDARVWALSESERLDYRRQIGMVFQHPNLFDTTVRRNVEYGRLVRREWPGRLRTWIRRLGNDEMDPAVVEALSVVGMVEAADRAASSLSGGEAQRVAFARALASNPDVLLLDEPTSDLDPRNTATIEEATRTACEQGMGVVVATHDMHQAERIADRVAVMINGHLIEIGPTDQVFEAPTDDRVRNFIAGDLVY